MPESQLAAVRDYCDTPYVAAAGSVPLTDEPHVETWIDYAARARRDGAVATLRDVFVQLRFPIREGLSRDEAYRGATLRGRFELADAFAPGVTFERPEAMTVAVVDSMAGRVPVVVAPARADFEALVRAFTERNEPVEVPASMGACLVSGLINWDRIRRYREAWAAAAADASDEAWGREFQALAARKPLYQDRLILLSTGPYSAVPASQSRGDPGAWASRSLAIRRDHELFHYFTYRRFGLIRSHVFDELVADFAGLIGADGAYDADLALRCLGIDTHPVWRPDARLLNYVRGALPEVAWPAIGTLAVRAVSTLRLVAHTHRRRLGTPAGRALVFDALCALTLDDLADAASTARVDRHVEALARE